MRADRDRNRLRLKRTARAALLGSAALLAGLLTPPPARADSVALSWTAPGDDGNTGRASSYELRYSETAVPADTAGWWASATSIASLPAPRTAGTRESFIVAGLPSAKTFYFAIRTFDEVPNVSGFSNIAVKQTSSTVTLVTPTNFSAAASEGVVLLTWDAVPASGPELGYRLYRKATTDPFSALLATIPLGTASYSDSTPAAGVSYDFSLATYDDTAESPRTSLTVGMPGAKVDLPVVHGYPNPARDQVTFMLKVDTKSSGAHTRVTIFDLTGHRVCLLADGVFTPGEHTLSWACKSDKGNRVAPGLYNVIVEGASGRSFTRLAIVP